MGAGANADPSQQGEWLLAQKKAAGDPLEQLRKGRLTGAGVVHVPVVYQHLVEQDHAGVAGERLPGEPRGEGHERRRRSPWGDRIAVRPGPGLCAVPRGDYTDFAGKVISVLFNTLSKFVIACLPRIKCLLISWV